MNRMPKRNVNTINFIISILVAFTAWLYVAYDVSPTITKTYHNVKINYTGEYDLGIDGMGVLSSSDDDLSVTVTLQRVDVSKVSSDDIIANVDVSNANKGSNTLPISIETPSGVTYKSQSTDSIQVEVTESNNVDVDVAVAYMDTDSATSGASTEPMATELSYDQVSVMGAKKLVDKVKYVVLPVSEDAVSSEKPYTFSVSPIAVDENGDKIPHIVVMPNTIIATVMAADVKTVKLNVPVTDSSSSSNKTYEAPKTVRIKGDKRALSSINQVDAESIDITDAKVNSSVAINLKLPDGVQVANASRNIKLKIISK